MKNIKYILFVAILLFVIFPGEGTPKGVIRPISQFTQLPANSVSITLMEQAMEQANINFQDVLNREGVRSILIPSDEAFTAFLENLGDDYTAIADFDRQGELDVLHEIISYHIVLGELRVAAADYSLMTLQGEPMIGLPGELKRVTNVGGHYASVVQEMDNIGHLSIVVIDKVLLPPSY